jgi:hypothetical protein
MPFETYVKNHAGAPAPKPMHAFVKENPAVTTGVDPNIDPTDAIKFEAAVPSKPKTSNFLFPNRSI